MLAHLGGDAQENFLAGCKRFVSEQTPRLDLTPGTLPTSAELEKMSLKQLAASVAQQYREIGSFVSGLSEEQLNKGAKIGFLKEFIGTEDITLAQWANTIADLHLSAHLDQLRALAK